MYLPHTLVRTGPGRGSALDPITQFFWGFFRGGFRDQSCGSTAESMTSPVRLEVGGGGEEVPRAEDQGV